jgi:hypothetical protein
MQETPFRRRCCDQISSTQCTTYVIESDCTKIRYGIEIEDVLKRVLDRSATHAKIAAQFRDR